MVYNFKEEEKLLFILFVYLLGIFFGVNGQ